MKFDKIIFIGDVSMIRRFNRNIKARFNVFYPECEECLHSGLISVTYSVVHTNDVVLNSMETLNAIAQATIDAEYSHNRHAGEKCQYTIIEG